MNEFPVFSTIFSTTNFVLSIISLDSRHWCRYRELPVMRWGWEPKVGSLPIPTKSSLRSSLIPKDDDDDVCRIFHSDYDAKNAPLPLASSLHPIPNLSYFRQSRFRRLALLSSPLHSSPLPPSVMKWATLRKEEQPTVRSARACLTQKRT